MDFFRKVPAELTEASARGGACSVIAMVLLMFMLCVEIVVFSKTEVTTKIDLDLHAGSQLRINFNLSFPHLHCDYASVDLWDKIGRNQANVTQNIEKWQLDEDGRRRMYQGRNRKAFDIEHDNHHPPLHELHENGVHVTELGAKDWAQFHSENEFVFVDFYAPWCTYCQQLHTTWEALAEELERRDIAVAVAAVDCVEHSNLCHELNVQTFPTLRFFHNGEQVNQGEYRFDRTVDALIDFVNRKMESENIYRQYPEARVAHAKNSNTDHPGCLVSGFLLVNRVPGNFHIMAHSRHHSLNTLRTNLSHSVNHLSFGVPLTDAQHRRLAQIDLKHTRTETLDATDYFHAEYHKAFQHFIHIVPSKYHLGTFWNERFSAFQTMHSHHLLEYQPHDPPEARFSYDLSPMAVVVELKRRKWYDFLTSLLAVLGGTFALFRLASDAVNRLLDIDISL